MNKDAVESKKSAGDATAPESSSPAWMLPLKLLAWPFVKLGVFLYQHFLSYMLGRVLRDQDRIYSIKFIWYGDSVYLHPMIWGSVILFFVQKSEVVGPGWVLLFWFVALGVCFLTVMYNFDIVRASVLLIAVAAVMGLAYFSTIEWAWNPLTALSEHVRWLDASVSSGFYIVSSYVFAGLIAAEVLWAWLFHRVEIDESYVYEHRFLQGTTREPIFARGLKRETKDLLELLILGAADIQHRTRNGIKRFKNVPAASLGLGTAIDSMLDYRRKGQIDLERGRDRDLDDQVRVEDAIEEAGDDWDDGNGELDSADDFAG